MQRVILIDLTGHERQFRLHEDAYERLRNYLAQAQTRLGSDPDAGEVVADLERSIGDRLADLVGPADRVLQVADVTAVLEQVGTVEVEGDAPPPLPPSAARGGAAPRPPRRRLYRIRERQAIAGVCTGLAAYADLDVDLVRAIFVLLTVFTAGGWLIVYLVLMFFLPVVDTRAGWLAEMERLDQAPGS